jgi:hypothetical protein
MKLKSNTGGSMDISKRTNLQKFVSFTFKVIIVHALTYFIFGLIFSNLFNYGELFRQNVIKDFMRPIDSSAVLWGPLLQPVRGLIFALGIWPLRTFLLERKYGWLILWNIMVVFGIISTPAAAPCSIEGLIYSKLPISYHLIGLPEILLQTLTFSFVLIWWVKRQNTTEEPRKFSLMRANMTRGFFAITIACFGYVGFAIGSIAIAKLAGQPINLNETSVSFKNQLMFIVAFLVNVVTIYILLSKTYFKRFTFWNLTLIFFIVDSLSIIIYQVIFTYMMPIYFILFIVLFPAVVIASAFKMNRKNFDHLYLE